jgi:hypothetical protein
MQPLEVDRQRALVELGCHRAALLVKKSPQRFANGTRGHDPPRVVRGDRARHRKVGRRADLADAKDHEPCLLGNGHDRTQAFLAKHDLPVLQAVGEKRGRHEIGLRACALGQLVDDLERVGRRPAGQAADKRDELDLRV